MSNFFKVDDIEKDVAGLAISYDSTGGRRDADLNSKTTLLSSSTSTTISAIDGGSCTNTTFANTTTTTTTTTTTATDARPKHGSGRFDVADVVGSTEIIHGLEITTLPGGQHHIQMAKRGCGGSGYGEVASSSSGGSMPNLPRPAPLSKTNLPAINVGGSSQLPKLGIRLSALTGLYERNKDKMENKTIEEIKNGFVKPLTASTRLSYCEFQSIQGDPGMGVAEVFISHAWSCKIEDVLRALNYHFRSARDICIWMSLFSVTQHDNFTSTKDAKWFNDTFKATIASFNHLVLVVSPWNDLKTLSRSWCLFEIFCCADTGSRFEIAMTHENLGEFIKDVSGDTTDSKAVDKALALVDCHASQCSDVTDRAKIFEAIDTSCGFENFDKQVRDILRESFIEMASTKLAELPNGDSTGKAEDIKAKEAVEIAIGNMYISQGKFDKAEPIFLASVQKKQTELGLAHPETLMAMTNLANMFATQGKYKRAKELFVQCYDVSKMLNGETHPLTIRLMDYIASIYLKQNKFQEARVQFEQSLEFNKKQFGKDHPYTLSVMNDLATCYHRLQKYNEARSLFEECLAVRKRTQGPSHPDTLLIMNNLANVYDMQGQLNKARPLYEACVEYGKEKFGQDSVQTLSFMNNLSYCYARQGRQKEAKTILEACLKSARAKLGDHHPSTIEYLNNLIMLRQMMTGGLKKLGGL